jgi:hypothetical protein
MKVRLNNATDWTIDVIDLSQLNANDVMWHKLVVELTKRLGVKQSLWATFKSSAYPDEITREIFAKESSQDLCEIYIPPEIIKSAVNVGEGNSVEWSMQLFVRTYSASDPTAYVQKASSEELFYVGNGLPMDENGLPITEYTLLALWEGVKEHADRLITLYTSVNETLPAIQNRLDGLEIYTKGYSVQLSVDPNTYVLTAVLVDGNGELLPNANKVTVDLPLESMIVGGEYNEETHTLDLTLKSGEKISVPFADLVNGIATKTEVETLDERVDGIKNDITALSEKVDGLGEGGGSGIEKIIKNGKELPISNKTVSFEVPTYRGMYAEGTTYNTGDFVQWAIADQTTGLPHNYLFVCRENTVTGTFDISKWVMICPMAMGELVGSNYLSNANLTKLNNIEAEAQVNIIEKIALNGVIAEVSDKTAILHIDAVSAKDFVDSINVLTNRIENIEEKKATKAELSAHNVSTDAHNDIRVLLQELTNHVTTLLDSDDLTLDQMSEIVAYIKANKSLIDSITTSKVNISDIIDNLTTNVTNKPLSAAQGVVLKALIDALSNEKLNASELSSAITTALTQAKTSGDFDGADGKSILHYNAAAGIDNSFQNAMFSNIPKIDDLVIDANYDLFKITGVLKDVAYGKKLGNIKGIQGADGVGVKTVAQTTTSSADGGSNVVTVTLTNGTTSTFTVKNGSKGSTGATGQQGPKGDTGATGPAGQNGADGKTPVKGTDYFTEADKQEMVSQVSNAFIQGENEVYQAVNAVYAQQATNDSNGKNIAENYVKKVDVPDYWLTALQNGAKAINTALCTAGPNKSAFLFYSDAHWNYGSQKSPLLLKYLYEHTGMTKTIFGGDIVNNEATDYEAMSYLWSWRNMLKGLPNHHSVVGNHDDGNETNNLFSEQYVYGYLLAPEETADIVRADGLYYYIDSPAEKTRYLYLDTAYKGVNSKQKEFVKNALISTKESWHIIAISHIWYDTNYSTSPPSVGALNSGASELLAMFDSYNSRSGEYASCKGWVEFCIGGHTHRDYDGATTTGIPIILVETDSQHVRSGLGYTVGTTNESSVNGIIADYDNHRIYVVRIGRGSSREIEVTNYEVSYTNLIPTAIDIDGTTILDGKGWRNNVRMSGSSGEYRDNTGTCCTGYIAVPTAQAFTVYLKNVKTDSTNQYGCNVYFFNGVHTAIVDSANYSELVSYYSPKFDSDGNLIEFKVADGANKTYTHIAIGAIEINETSIITIDEPID